MTREILGRELERVLMMLESEVSERCNDLSTLTGNILNEGFDVPRDVLDKIIGAAGELLQSPGPYSGNFIVFSGIDKVGKTTQCFNPKRIEGVTSIEDFLISIGKKVLTTSLPSYNTLLGSIVGAYLRRGSELVIKGKISKDYAWILWSLDRAQYNSKISKWLKLGIGQIVLSDRWMESNVVYQRMAGVDEKRILAFEKNIIKQNYTIILDMKPENIDDRFKLSGETKDLYENISFLQDVRKTYLKLSEHYPFGNYQLIDSSRPPNLVNRAVIDYLKTLNL